MVGLNFKSAEEATAFAEVLTRHLAVDDRLSGSVSDSSDSAKVKTEEQQLSHHQEHLEAGNHMDF